MAMNISSKLPLCLGALSVLLATNPPLWVPIVLLALLLITEESSTRS
jgi:hypothetical protein